MPENHGPPRADIVDITVAVGIVYVTTVGTGDEKRLNAYGFTRSHRAVDTTGDKGLGLAIEVF
jgi:hypothetical protein